MGATTGRGADGRSALAPTASMTLALFLAALAPGDAARAEPNRAPPAPDPATTRAHHETMLRCAHRWRDLKQSGRAGRLTWRSFWAKCSAEPQGAPER